MARVRKALFRLGLVAVVTMGVFWSDYTWTEVLMVPLVMIPLSCVIDLRMLDWFTGGDGPTTKQRKHL